MNDNQIVDSSFAAIINAPLDRIDPTWCFTLPERENQACPPAHVSPGFFAASIEQAVLNN